MPKYAERKCQTSPSRKLHTSIYKCDQSDETNSNDKMSSHIAFQQNLNIFTNIKSLF